MCLQMKIILLKPYQPLPSWGMVVPCMQGCLICLWISSTGVIVYYLVFVYKPLLFSVCLLSLQNKSSGPETAWASDWNIWAARAEGEGWQESLSCLLLQAPLFLLVNQNPKSRAAPRWTGAWADRQGLQPCSNLGCRCLCSGSCKSVLPWGGAWAPMPCLPQPSLRGEWCEGLPFACCGFFKGSSLAKRA